jgi:hypothetical protein
MTHAGASNGVVIQNLTLCGGGNTWYNSTPGLNPALMSTGPPCSDEHLPNPTVCNYSNQCSDLTVDSAAVDLNSPPGNYPWLQWSPSSGHPFAYSYAGPFAVEINNVDFEDSPGNAIKLYATANTTGYPAKFVNDVWIHGSTINYSAITGILYGYNFVEYDDKYCDSYGQNNPYAFYDDPALFPPRNILIENNSFNYNNTGAMGGGAMRAVGLRNNSFYVNYISPQAGNTVGGAIGLDRCADAVEISYNTIVGPNNSTGKPPGGYAPFAQTSGLELYGRNFNVHDNTITGHGANGIGAFSLFQGTISKNHVLQDNGWSSTEGGIDVVTWSPWPVTAPCDLMPRDTNGAAISANDSNAKISGLPVGPGTQAYGIFFGDYPSDWSTDRLNAVTAGADNSLFDTVYPVFLGPFVGLYNSAVDYSQVGSIRLPNPRALPVDVISAYSSNPPNSFLWPVPPRCPEIVEQKLAPPPLGTKMGSPRATFRFSASDPAGASNIMVIWGIFSVGGDDATGSGGPSGSYCNFAYDAVGNYVYMGDGNGGWILPPSPVGSGGFDLQGPGGCIIHAASSTSWISLGRPQAVPTAYVVDLILDVSLPSSPPSRYHIYSWTENANYLFDGCGAQPQSCPAWEYSGYWWNVN